MYAAPPLQVHWHAHVQALSDRRFQLQFLRVLSVQSPARIGSTTALTCDAGRPPTPQRFIRSGGAVVFHWCCVSCAPPLTLATGCAIHLQAGSKLLLLCRRTQFGELLSRSKVSITHPGGHIQVSKDTTVASDLNEAKESCHASASDFQLHLHPLCCRRIEEGPLAGLCSAMNAGQMADRLALVQPDCALAKNAEHEGL